MHLGDTIQFITKSVHSFTIELKFFFFFFVFAFNVSIFLRVLNHEGVEFCKKLALYQLI